MEPPIKPHDRSTHWLSAEGRMVTVSDLIQHVIAAYSDRLGARPESRNRAPVVP